MNLLNRKGDEFRLEIIGYQSPDILDSYWDSNWLNVRMSGNYLSSLWSVQDPCLLTFEVENLAKWLEKLVLDKSSSDISFTEPSPRFKVIKHRTGSYLLRVDLGYIFRKNMPDIFGEKKIIRLYFRLNEIGLPHQVYLLRKQLKNYPQRVSR